MILQPERAAVGRTFESRNDRFKTADDQLAINEKKPNSLKPSENSSKMLFLFSAVFLSCFFIFSSCFLIALKNGPFWSFFGLRTKRTRVRFPSNKRWRIPRVVSSEFSPSKLVRFPQELSSSASISPS